MGSSEAATAGGLVKAYSGSVTGPSRLDGSYHMETSSGNTSTWLRAWFRRARRVHLASSPPSSPPASILPAPASSGTGTADIAVPARLRIAAGVPCSLLQTALDCG